MVERKWPQANVAGLIETDMLKQMVNDMSAWSAFDTGDYGSFPYSLLSTSKKFCFLN